MIVSISYCKKGIGDKRIFKNLEKWKTQVSRLISKISVVPISIVT